MENIGSKGTLFEKFISNRGRVAELALGLTANKLLNWGFDYFFYPFIIYKYGILQGGVAMTILSFFACLLMIIFYDWAKKDWLGIEFVRELKTYQGNNKIGRLTAWILQKSEPAALLFLSLYYDSFIIVVYMRHGSYNGMTKRDWKIFTGSLLLGNAYWTLACYMGVSLVEWVWQLMKGLV